MESTKEVVKKPAARSRVVSIAFCGLTIAMMAVSAWVSIPLGPVPFTLQTFTMVFALVALTPKECLASLVGYLAIGAIGLPVFSSMRGGIGVLAGPTGGFLWGYLVGALIALLIIGAITRSRSDASDRVRVIAYGVGTFAFMVVMYVCGWVQFMAVTGTDPLGAFTIAIAPFIIVDIIKAVFAIGVALAVKKALRR